MARAAAAREECGVPELRMSAASRAFGGSPVRATRSRSMLSDRENATALLYPIHPSMSLAEWPRRPHHGKTKRVLNSVGVDLVRFEGTSDGDRHFVRDDATFDGPTSVVPEPITMVLLATGLAGVASLRRRRNVQS
jgi:hypothetical protein